MGKYDELLARLEWSHLNRSYLIDAAYDGDETLYDAFMQQLVDQLEAAYEATEGV